MKTGFLFVSSVIAVALIIAASQIIAAGAGSGSVSPQDRLSIEQSRYSGQWKSNDLTVEYSYSKDQGQMDLSGNVQFASYMTMGYSRLQDFRLVAIILDENGRVLQEIGLTTNRGALDPVDFHNRIKLPSNAVFMAFSYQGTAIESLKGGQTSFTFYPVR